MHAVANHRPIGIFDSGLGGLTITAAVRQALPNERLFYFGDTVHMPYGQRALDEVRAFSVAIAEALLTKGCKLIVVACNTASAAALSTLRERFPDTQFVGMEPAVKPAVEQTRTGVVGVLATSATFQSELYASVVERFAHDVEVLREPCPGLVPTIERGELDTPGTEAMLRGWLEPMLQRGIDALVLGCTHYPLVRPVIERIVGPDVRVIDPAPAVARQVQRLLGQDLEPSVPDGEGGVNCWTSGDPEVFRAMLDRLGMGTCTVERGSWSSGRLSLP